MRFREFIPRFLKNYLRLVRLKLKYPGRYIDSPYVHPQATLGKKCRIYRDVVIGPDVCLGDYSYVNIGSIIASGRIGKYCSFGYYCQVGLPEHPVTSLSTSPFIYGQNNLLGIRTSYKAIDNPPLIENDVWIGSHSVVLQGVVISNGAIVAAGSVVTRNVPPYAIVGGVPAKIIKYRFSPKTIDFLMNLKWWDFQPDELWKIKELVLAEEELEEHLIRGNYQNT